MNPGLVTFNTQPVETGDNKDHVADRSLCYLAIISHISRICYRTIILFSCTFVLLCHQLSTNKIGPWWTRRLSNVNKSTTTNFRLFALALSKLDCSKLGSTITITKYSLLYCTVTHVNENRAPDLRKTLTDAHTVAIKENDGKKRLIRHIYTFCWHEERDVL